MFGKIEKNRVDQYISEYDSYMNIVEISYGDISAKIDMDEGMNVVSLKKNGIECLIYDDSRRKSGATYAIPILFPTPNRTKNNSYSYCKRDVKTVMHGYARHTSFVEISRDLNSVTGYSDFNGNEYCFHSISLTVRISIVDKTLHWDFHVENHDNIDFPFSIALHPFFDKRVFHSLSSDCKEAMITTDDLLPTGEVSILEESFISPRKIDEIDLDTVFLSDDTIESTLIGDDFSLSIKGSDEFNHVVIFSSPDRPFICVEPQTGSTDCVNLHNRGFERVANLLVLAPEESKDLSVDFLFK